MHIGDFISGYLLKNKLSQRQFARDCGLSNGYISMLINNVNPRTGKPLVPSLTALISLAKGMKITVDELIAKTDDIDVDITLARNIIDKKQVKDISNRVIPKNIKAVREKLNITKNKFAEELGLKESDIDDIENGVYNLNKETVFKICDVLKTTPDFLDGTIYEMLENGDADAEYRYLKQQKQPPVNDLSEDERRLIEKYRKINPEAGEMLLTMVNIFEEMPQDRAQMLLAMIRAGIENQG